MAGVGFLSGYDVLVCAQCGLGFAGGIPTQAEFNAYYHHLSKYDHESREGQQSAADLQRLRDTAATLIPFVPSTSARILDIGCSTGFLLSLVRGAGFQKVRGLDPSPQSAKSAWELFQLSVDTGSIVENSIPDGSVDFAILIAVLEHVEGLEAAVQRLKRMLAPGGRIFAEVPDASRFAGRPDAPFQEFSVEHINFFSKVSLANLFREHGFRPILTGEADRQQDENMTGPTAYGIFEAGSAASSLDRDNITEPGLRRYIEESSAGDSRVREAIKERVSGRPIIVWGTGTHTQRLLAAGAFATVTVRAFVDSNPKYQGHDLSGIPIVAPQSLHSRSEPILISTRGFQREIYNQIRDHLGLKNELILLYELD